MKKIFWGLIFIFFDLRIFLGPFVVGLIPTFVGYIFIVQGLSQLSFESSWFDKAHPFAIGMSIYSGVLYILDLFGANSYFSSAIVISQTLSLLSSVFHFLILYFIVLGIRDIESYYKADLNYKPLMILVTLEAIFTTLSSVWALLSIFIGNMFLAVIFVVACVILNIILLVLFQKSRRVYEQIPKHAGSVNNN